MRMPIIIAGLFMTSPAICAEIRTLAVFDFSANPGKTYMLEHDLSGFYKLEISIMALVPSWMSRCFLRAVTDQGGDGRDLSYDYLSSGILSEKEGKPEPDTNSSATDNFTSDKIFLQDSENRPMSPIHGEITILDPGSIERKAVRAWIVANDIKGRTAAEQTFGFYLRESPLRGVIVGCGDPIVSGRIIVTGYSLQDLHDNQAADDVTAQIEPLTPTLP